MSGERGREEYQELLANVIEECTSLEMLVQQLLLLAETDSARLTTYGEYFSLSEVVARSVEMFRAVEESRGIELSMDLASQVTIQGKRHHLRQVMNNLLDNAIKFTPGPGRVMVELVIDEKTQQAVLSVRDTGVGIPPDDLPRVFERFFRGDRSHTRIPIGGTGLGLSICQAVVQAHGGNILIESSLGQGTRVTVILPLAPSDAKVSDQEALGHLS
jgi:signal transduction histidine kinase